MANIILYSILACMSLIIIVVLWWQIQVLKGKAMKNPDGAFDDWHEQKIFFGIAIADIFVAIPTTLAGIIMILINIHWGFYILALASFWFFWSNIMTTTTSLRFEKPKMTIEWFIVYPFGTLVGLAYIIWSIIYFDMIY
jgi:hypothetical protein